MNTRINSIRVFFLSPLSPHTKQFLSQIVPVYRTKTTGRLNNSRYGPPL